MRMGAKCGHCGQPVQADAVFCPKCGSKIRKWKVKYLIAAGAVLMYISVLVISTQTHPVSHKAATASPQGLPASKNTPSPKSQRWDVAEEREPMEGKPRVAISVDAENNVQGRFGHENPRLIIRCQDGKTELAVKVGMASETDPEQPHMVSVRLKFDHRKPIRQYWIESTDYEALFSSNPINLARELTGVHTLLFEFRPFRRGPEVAEFSLDGLSEVLPKVSKTCGWTF
jgi:hypothetical protein